MKTSLYYDGGDSTVGEAVFLVIMIYSPLGLHLTGKGV